MKEFVALALALACFVPASAEDCAALMKFGIYDKYQTLTTEFRFGQIQRFFKSNQFTSRKQAEDKALEIGIDIIEILGLNFGGKSSTDQFEQWQQELIASSYQQSLAAGLNVTTVEKISNTITELVEACLKKKGVHAYIIPSDDMQHFTFTIDFIPHNNKDLLTKGSFAVTPSSVAGTASPKGLLDKELEIGPAGVSVSFRRLPTETVTFTYSTGEGSGVVRYDAFVVPKPIISFRTSAETLQSGEMAKLVWDVQHADSVEIVGKGRVSDAGSIDVAPETDTEYQLRVTSLDGKTVSSFAKIKVLPPPPVLKTARVNFDTTNDNKDDDTAVSSTVMYGEEVVATAYDTYGEFDDPSSSGWKDLKVTRNIKKDSLLSAGRFALVEHPNGHDEWHFHWALELSFSDGSTKRYEGDGDVDYDRPNAGGSF